MWRCAITARFSGRQPVQNTIGHALRLNPVTCWNWWKTGVAVYPNSRRAPKLVNRGSHSYNVVATIRTRNLSQVFAFWRCDHSTSAAANGPPAVLYRRARTARPAASFVKTVRHVTKNINKYKEIREKKPNNTTDNTIFSTRRHTTGWTDFHFPLAAYVRTYYAPVLTSARPDQGRRIHVRVDVASSLYTRTNASARPARLRRFPSRPL